MMQFAGSTAPSGWLICDGTKQLRATYAALFAVIGTTYNTGGELATEFRLPDMRQRVAIGAGDNPAVAGAGVALAAVGGTASYTLTISELPQHDHTSAAHTHTSAAHTHTFSATSSSNAIPASAATAFDASPTATTRPVGQTTGTFTDFTVAGSAHTHTVSGTTASTTPGNTGSTTPSNTGTTGSATPNAVPTQDPYLALYHIIKT
jgi:microcystin-dependent protein